MKIGVVLFHSNIFSIYRKEWVSECIESLRNQTFNDLHFYEIDYGESNTQLLKESKFINKSTENHADAMNIVITEAFEDGCDFVFNTNMDDYYDVNRIQVQLEAFNNKDINPDLVFSNFDYVNPDGNYLLTKECHKFGDLASNLINGHNILCHPSVGFRKELWDNIANRYIPAEKPKEDLHFWQRLLLKGYKFHICKEALTHYRIHDNQITRKSRA